MDFKSIEKTEVDGNLTTRRFKTLSFSSKGEAIFTERVFSSNTKTAEIRPFVFNERENKPKERPVERNRWQSGRGISLGAYDADGFIRPELLARPCSSEKQRFLREQLVASQMLRREKMLGSAVEVARRERDRLEKIGANGESMFSSKLGNSHYSFAVQKHSGMLSALDRECFRPVWSRAGLRGTEEKRNEERQTNPRDIESKESIANTGGDVIKEDYRSKHILENKGNKGGLGGLGGLKEFGGIDSSLSQLLRSSMLRSSLLQNEKGFCERSPYAAKKSKFSKNPPVDFSAVIEDPSVSGPLPPLVVNDSTEGALPTPINDLNTPGKDLSPCRNNGSTVLFVGLGDFAEDYFKSESVNILKTPLKRALAKENHVTFR